MWISLEGECYNQLADKVAGGEEEGGIQKIFFCL